ncbi:MAG: hypothetical protein ACFHWZ_06845 [Phycisphaerales bacterium]
MNPESNRPLPLPGNLDDLLDGLGQGGSGVLSMSEIKTLAVHTWRLGQRIERLDDSDARVKRQLSDSHRKLMQLLEDADIEVVDPINQPYTTGWLEVEVIAYEEPDGPVPEGVTDAWIKQTMRPIVRHENRVILKGEVVVAEPAEQTETAEDHDGN